MDGVYTQDPNKYKMAKKLDKVSYEEMLKMANNGAKVLHNKCVEIAKEYKVPIIVKSTFCDGPGTIVGDYK